MAQLESIPQTVPQLVAAAAATYADKVAIQQDGCTITYRQLGELARQAGKSFIAAGIQAGDRVAVWAPNLSEWIIASLGLQSVGGVLVPLNTRMKGSEAADIINRSGSRLVLSIPSFQSSASTTIEYFALLADQNLPKVERLIALCGTADGVQSWEDFLASGAGVSDAEFETRAQAVDGDDAVDMLFTSGTTGKPKGVVCSHSQNIRAFAAWSGTVGLNDDDNYLIINPFFHSFGYKAGWLAALIRGCRILPVLTFDLDAVMQQIQDDQVTMLPGPPTIYQSMLMHPRRAQYDLSSLRLGVTGAASVPVELVRKMRSELGFASVVTAYGLTETSGVVTVCRPDDDAETIANTSGRALPGVEVLCVDGEGNEVPRGEPGEIWVRGYNVMKEYFEMPEATAETITEDGWLKTGDVGVMDERGYIRITDRLKDMYISGGFNVYPAEIENALCSLEGVAQAAVIGIPDERMGEVGMAFVVLRPGSELDEAAVMSYCKANLANYKLPRRVRILEALPLNASGKVMKPELRALAAKG